MRVKPKPNYFVSSLLIYFVNIMRTE